MASLLPVGKPSSAWSCPHRALPFLPSERFGFGAYFLVFKCICLLSSDASANLPALSTPGNCLSGQEDKNREETRTTWFFTGERAPTGSSLPCSCLKRILYWKRGEATLNPPSDFTRVTSPPQSPQPQYRRSLLCQPLPGTPAPAASSRTPAHARHVATPESEPLSAPGLPPRSPKGPGTFRAGASPFLIFVSLAFVYKVF